LYLGHFEFRQSSIVFQQAAAPAALMANEEQVAEMDFALLFAIHCLSDGFPVCALPDWKSSPALDGPRPQSTDDELASSSRSANVADWNIADSFST